MADPSTQSTASKRLNRLSISDLKASQLDTIDQLYESDETLLIGGLGAGKCIIGLTAAQELIKDGVLERVLVLAPLRVCTLTWAAEIYVWDHIDETDVSIACGTAKRREQAVQSGARIIVTNFESLDWMLENHGDEFDGVLIDEMTKLKTVGSGAARALRFWVKKLKWRVGMTATPVSEAGPDIYTQALLLDLGKSLGTRKEKFLRTYFYPEDFQNRKWLPFPDTYKKLGRAMADLIYRMDDAEYLAGLPEEHEHVLTVDPGAGWRDVYDAMQKKRAVKINGTKVVAKSAGDQVNKLHQLAAGGLYGRDKDDKQILVYRDRAKMEAVQRLVARLEDQGRPVLICYQYQFELDDLLAWRTAPVLGAGTKVTHATIEAFQEGKIPVIFMHHKSASHGLNLQHACADIIHLSPIWGADPWTQTLGRIRRRGQPQDAVNRWVFVVEDTVDEAALAGQDTKEERAKDFMEELG